MITQPSAAPSPRRSVPGWAIALLVAGALGALALCAIVGIGALTLLGRTVEPTVVTAIDGQSQVTVPGTWKSRDDLNDQAELQVANPAREQYLIVLTEARSDLVGFTLETYAQTVLDNLAVSLDDPTISEARPLTLGGRPAVQYEVRGTVDRIRAVYWLTAVEGSSSYFQVLTWTIESKAEGNAQVLQDVVASFREL